MEDEVGIKDIIQKSNELIDNANKATYRYFNSFFQKMDEIADWITVLEKKATIARIWILQGDERSAMEAFWLRFQHAILEAEINKWQEKSDSLFEEVLTLLKVLNKASNFN
jgi:hypothetical protein